MLTLLLKMHLLGVVRSDQFKSWLIGRMVILLIFVLPALVLASLLGIYLEDELIRFFGDREALPMIHTGIILLLLGIGIMEPIIKKDIPIPLQSYLCLPVSRNQLALLYHMQSGCNLNNFWILVFLTSVWSRSILTRYPPGSAILWLLLSLILLLGSHFISNAFRLILWKSVKVYVFLTATILLVWLFTLTRHFDLWLRLSNALYESSLNGHYAGIGCSLGFAVLMLILLMKMTAPTLFLDQRIHPKRYSLLSHPDNKQSDSLRLIIFELRLLIRNARTKPFFLNLVIFPLWGASMLLTGIRDGRVFMLGVGLLLVMNVTGMSYTLLGFRLKSIFYDHLITLPYPTTSLVNTVIIVSHVITTISFLLVFLLFILSGIRLLVPLFGIYLYSLGVVNYVNAYLITYQTRRYDITSTAFNRRELTDSNPLRSLTTTLIVSLPPIGLFALSQGSPEPALFVLLGLAGVAGMASQQRWMRAIVNGLQKKKYALLTGFRST